MLLAVGGAYLQDPDGDGLGEVRRRLGVEGEDHADDDADGGDEAQRQDVEEDLGLLHPIVDHFVANLRRDWCHNNILLSSAEMSLQMS